VLTLHQATHGSAARAVRAVAQAEASRATQPPARRAPGYAAIMRTEGLRSDAITAALDQAIAGKPERLYRELALVSGLPGPRANLTIANAFATECAARGKAADKLLFHLATLDADVAPGATEHEFLPLCGVLGLGARAALDPKIRAKVVATLHDAAEDMRFRVRDAVPVALARIGEKEQGALVAELAGWTDGFFQAAAAILALADATWLTTLTDPGPVVDRLDEAFRLARDAPRSASRYPGRKALVDALAVAPAAIAARFGVPVFDMLAAWSKTEMPELRAVVQTTLRSNKLAGRYATEIARVHQALDASVAPPRDPTILVQGMRGRGKKRGRR
jgi:hypothetical protein